MMISRLVAKLSVTISLFIGAALSSAEPTVVVLAGDSTVTGKRSSVDQAGWGWALQQLSGPDVIVYNEALGGRSSLSFRSEGHWDKVLARSGDWVFIQFGHNDQRGKGPERESDPRTTYRDHLREYIAEVREQGGNPILVTPVCRRVFSSDGTLRDSLEAYAEAVRIVAAETEVPYIDLHQYSYDAFTEMGPEACALLGPQEKPKDKTHFSTSGSLVIAQWVLLLLDEKVPELADLFIMPTENSNPQPILQIRTPEFESSEVIEVPGPFPNSTGVRSRGKSAEVSVPLESATPLPQGTLSTWIFLSEAQLSGPQNDAWKENILEAKGLFDLSIGMDTKTFGAFFNWRGSQKDGGYIRCLIPGLAGPGWHHLAAVWDIEAGTHNLYLDGQPCIDGEIRFWESLPVPSPEELTLNLNHMGLYDVRLYDVDLSQKQIGELLSQLYRGSSDFLLGARPLGPLNLDRDSLQLIHEDSFRNDSPKNDWVLEGPGVLEYSPEGLTMKSSKPDGEVPHFVWWLDKELPDRFVAEWNVQILSELGLNIVFFAATGPDGSSIFDSGVAPRNGDFKQYHSGDINCYHISYYADAPGAPGRSTANLRKNKGFYLVSNGPAGIPADSHATHRITLVKDGPHIQLAVDGELSIDWKDDGQHYGPVHGAGRFGLRQMEWTEARYSDLKIYAIQ